MRNLAFLSLALFLGCSRTTQIRVVDVGSDDFSNPMPFALKIDNGGSPTQVDAIAGECHLVNVVSPDPTAKLPNAGMRIGLTDDRHRTLGDDDTITLAGMTDVWGIVGWELPDDSPP